MNLEQSGSSANQVSGAAADPNPEVKLEVLPTKVEPDTIHKKEGEGRATSLRKMQELSRTAYQS
jgi:hypothetical protein